MKLANLLVLFFLLSLTLASAQRTPSPFVVKAGVQYGETPYESYSAIGPYLQLDYGFTDKLFISGGLGFFGKKHIVNGEVKLIQPDGNQIGNTFQFSQREYFNHLDLSLKYALFGSAQTRNRFMISAGGSLAVSVFDNYSFTLIGQDGSILEQDHDLHIATVPMLHFSIEDDFNLTSRLVLFAKAWVRTSLAEASPLYREIRFENGFSVISENGIKTVFSGSIGIGYRL